MKDATLIFENVTITYPNGFCAARDVRLRVEAGECLALVGESGSGKTTLARAALGLLPKGARIAGSIRVGGTEIIGACEAELRSLRGRVVGFVAQDPFAACDPLSQVKTHVAEAWRAHGMRPPEGAITNKLQSLGIVNAAHVARSFPHQWSGGMLQRAVIAAASAHEPKLIIADEPTSALDSMRADETLRSLRHTKAAILLISHDFNHVATHADRIAVLRAGRLVETSDTQTVLRQPQHPYTVELLNAFSPAHTITPASFAEGALVIEADNLSRIYGHGDAAVRAVRAASLRVSSGEVVGIHGASGCGKSTLLRLLATIESPTSGTIKLGGELATQGGSTRLLTARTRSGYVMPIFQDPVGSLDRRWAIWRTVTEPLTASHHKIRLSRSARREKAREQLAQVGLAKVDLDARPDELSVGQCQRVAIARALVAQPSLIIADEPTSALDTSVAATILRLLADAARKNTAIVIVSHDRQILRAICHRVVEMKDGVLNN